MKLLSLLQGNSTRLTVLLQCRSGSGRSHFQGFCFKKFNIYKKYHSINKKSVKNLAVGIIKFQVPKSEEEDIWEEGTIEPFDKRKAGSKTADAPTTVLNWGSSWIVADQMRIWLTKRGLDFEAEEANYQEAFPNNGRVRISPKFHLLRSEQVTKAALLEEIWRALRKMSIIEDYGEAGNNN
ncbi:hypothetical protein AAHA92_22812 [Salvia divinorum]|uniref:Uncharacterized protein n=1 Tax=Salvia divinorum TaxID=28513 RepID=A0ABD1GPV7_SALDI